MKDARGDARHQSANRGYDEEDATKHEKIYCASQHQHAQNSIRRNAQHYYLVSCSWLRELAGPSCSVVPIRLSLPCPPSFIPMRSSLLGCFWWYCLGSSRPGVVDEVSISGADQKKKKVNGESGCTSPHKNRLPNFFLFFSPPPQHSPLSDIGRLRRAACELRVCLTWRTAGSGR